LEWPFFSGWKASYNSWLHFDHKHAILKQVIFMFVICSGFPCCKEHIKWFCCLLRSLQQASPKVMFAAVRPYASFLAKMQSLIKLGLCVKYLNLSSITGKQKYFQYCSHLIKDVGSLRCHSLNF
jgi:hypothetical protein